MPAHSALTGTNLHEPKGVAGEAQGKVYVSDGSNSGSWEYIPTGWALYHDDGGTQVFSATAAKLTVDGVGTDSISTYLPREIRGSDELWDVSTSDVTPIALGDLYNVQLILPVSAKATSPKTLTVEFDVGATGAVSEAILTRTVEITNVATSDTLVIDLLVRTTANFVTNGGQIFLSTDVGTLTVNNPSVFISRTHGEQ